MNPVGILLAAGRGRRFDPEGLRNKLLQPLPTGEAVVVASAHILLSVVPRVIAVVPPQDGGVAAALRALGCEVTTCQDADSGMAASLVHAIAHSLPQADAWLVALGDMPYVAPGTLRALLAALEEGAGIAAPVFEGRRGNPVAFGQQHLPALLALKGEHGARVLLKSEPVAEVAVMDPGILRDIDTPADL
ncbi:NTP transferase domain-containing protein [Massilia sp. Mn16-1_5]|uniref:nucleotidyltransferase family protein n=1 Tax=Massilia sp. Mn16-1_5 TaxID=2079199 RepID=UPI00109ED7C0|nr:nucleotidyltransferase family protein [Massilia sp. Mn16-1_5]THC44336.1 molybdopterin-guanine dinucleotide biosynthesis protein MobA [Massilia sp. Mn16-1_5]